MTSPSQKSRRPVRVVVRILIVAIAASALVLGYLGIKWYVHTQAGSNFGQSGWDILYYTLQLFVLGSKPLEEGYGDFGWMLHVARYLAAVATVSALILTVTELFDASFQRWLRGHRRGHAIVVGGTRAAESIAAALGTSTRVERVATGDVKALTEAGVANASHLFACEPDDEFDRMVNVITAMNAAATRSAKRNRRPLLVTAHVSDPILAVTQAGLTTKAPRAAVIRFVDINAEAAASHLRRLRLPEAANPLVVVAGLDGYGSAMLVELARAWGTPETPLAVTVVDRRAGEITANLAARWPMVAANLDMTALDSDFDDTVPLNVGRTPSFVFLCYAQDDETRRAALAAATWWNTEDESTVVRLNQFLPEDAGSSVSTIQRIFADGISRLKIVDVPDVESLLGGSGDYLDGLAALVHTRYLENELAQGVVMRTRPALRPWIELTDDLRAANRAQVAFYPSMLRILRCHIALRDERYVPLVLTGPEIEQLAQQEHNRWMVERQAAGWTYGEKRDDEKKRHPDLVPWDRLAPDSQRRDRDAALNIQVVFESFLVGRGLQVVRGAEPPPQRSLLSQTQRMG